MSRVLMCCRKANTGFDVTYQLLSVHFAAVVQKLTNVRYGEYDSDTCQICRDKANWTFVNVYDSCAFSLGTWIMGSGKTLLGHNRAET